ncbi:HNH endonuclease [Streptomyces sp. NBC_01264]|uniref:HNH endonuclease n=1 Tax=Streptomyces sp. NBC_01264 TaxID=2903804 RepID=UPI002257C7CB|nr:HNH endonuclease [Streptomyces sp. NBC_01264]MCX4780068.1 HNH endonuclease [Streptomyces sp. NBC_01264]
MPKRHDLTTYAYRKQRARLLAESNVCHLCGHPGADVVDHVRPVSRGADPEDTSNWLPAHGVKRCPTCGRNCNGEKGAATRTAGLKTSRDWYTR